jgi:hypothetical protein
MSLSSTYTPLKVFSMLVGDACTLLLSFNYRTYMAVSSFLGHGRVQELGLHQVFFGELFPRIPIEIAKFFGPAQPCVTPKIIDT